MPQNDGRYYRAGSEPGSSFNRGPAAEVPPRGGAPLSRRSAKYIGFYFWWWAGVTVLLTLGSLLALVEGKIGTGFLGLLFAGLAALYARYLFRGGRFRMIFIIF